MAFRNRIDDSSPNVFRIISVSEGVPIRIFAMSGKHGQKQRRSKDDVAPAALSDNGDEMVEMPHNEGDDENGGHGLIPNFHQTDDGEVMEFDLSDGEGLLYESEMPESFGEGEE